MWLIGLVLKLRRRAIQNDSIYDKAAVYMLVNKIHRGFQTQSTLWQFFHVYAEGSIKHPDNEKGTVYACCSMCGKDINYKRGNSGLITHIKARH